MGGAYSGPKSVEIDNSVFQDLDSFGRARILKMAVEIFFYFCLGKF